MAEKKDITELKKRRFTIIKAMTTATNPQEKDRMNAEFSKIDKELAQAQQPEEEIPAKAVQLEFFPEWEERKGVMPNHISRSALFACVHPGRRKLHDKMLIASRSDAEIKYTGYQLDMGDSDVFIQTIRTINHLNLGNEIQIFPYLFLRQMGRGAKTTGKAGKAQKLWLDRAFDRLTHGTLSIYVPGKYKAILHLVDEYIHDEETESYYVRMNPKIIKLFKKEWCGLFDWEARKCLTQPLAKWLQTYASSNQAGVIQIIGVQKLKVWCGQENRRPDHFNTALEKALEELDKKGIFTDIFFDKKKKKISYVALTS